MSQEELELYSYTELAKMILKEEKRSLNTPTIFKKICHSRKKNVISCRWHFFCVFLLYNNANI